MKMNEVYVGSCYVVDDAFGELPCVKFDIENSKLPLLRKTTGSRPFCVIDKDEKNNIVWLAPMSTKFQKYKDIHLKKIKEKGKCDNFVFTLWNNKNNVILLQNAFPITPNYIKGTFIKNIVGKKFSINENAQKIMQKSWGTIKALRNKGYELSYANVSSYLDTLYKNDYRHYVDLSDSEKKLVIEKWCLTPALEKAKNTERYNEEFAKINSFMACRKQILYNTHTMKMRKLATYDFGNTGYNSFDNEKVININFHSAIETLTIASTLDRENIKYRGVIDDNSRGRIKILQADRERYVEAIQKPCYIRKALGTLPYKEIDNVSCTKLAQPLSYRLAIRVTKKLYAQKIRYRCEFAENGTANLIFKKNDADKVNGTIKNIVDELKNNLAFDVPQRQQPPQKKAPVMMR